MCKLCDDNHNAVPDERTMEIMPVLYNKLMTDHRAMERLRKGNVRISVMFEFDKNYPNLLEKAYWNAYTDNWCFNDVKISNDPADAILAEGENEK
jgi:hypothetical protein